MRWMGGWNYFDLMTTPAHYLGTILVMIREEAERIEGAKDG